MELDEILDLLKDNKKSPATIRHIRAPENCYHNGVYVGEHSYPLDTHIFVWRSPTNFELIKGIYVIVEDCFFKAELKDKELYVIYGASYGEISMVRDPDPNIFEVFLGKKSLKEKVEYHQKTYDKYNSMLTAVER